MDRSSELANWDGSLLNSQTTVRLAITTPAQQEAELQPAEDLFNFADVFEETNLNTEGAQEWNVEPTSILGNNTQELYNIFNLQADDMPSVTQTSLFDLSEVDSQSATPATSTQNLFLQTNQHDITALIQELFLDNRHPSTLFEHNLLNQPSSSKTSPSHKDLPSFDNQYLQVYANYSASFDNAVSPPVSTQPEEEAPFMLPTPSASDAPELTSGPSTVDTSGTTSPQSFNHDSLLSPQRRPNCVYVDLVRRTRPAVGPPIISYAEYKRIIARGTAGNEKKAQGKTIHDSLSAAYNHVAAHDTINPRRFDEDSQIGSSDDDVIMISSTTEPAQPQRKRRKIYRAAGKARLATKSTVVKYGDQPTVSTKSSPVRRRPGRPRRRPTSSAPPAVIESPIISEVVVLDSEPERSRDSPNDGQDQPKPLRLTPIPVFETRPSRVPSPVSSDCYQEEWVLLPDDAETESERSSSLRYYPTYSFPPPFPRDPWIAAEIPKDTAHPNWPKIEGAPIPPSAITRSWGDDEEWSAQPEGILAKLTEVNHEPSSDVEEVETVQELPPMSIATADQVSCIDVSSTQDPLQSPSTLTIITAQASPVVASSLELPPPSSSLATSTPLGVMVDYDTVAFESFDDIQIVSTHNVSLTPLVGSFDFASAVAHEATISPLKTIAPHLLGGPSRLPSPSPAPSEIDNEEAPPSTQASLKIVVPRLGPVNGKRRPLRGAGVDARKVHKAREEAEALAEQRAVSSSRDIKGKGRAVELILDVEDQQQATFTDNDDDVEVVADEDDDDYAPAASISKKDTAPGKRGTLTIKIGPPGSASTRGKAPKAGRGAKAGPFQRRRIVGRPAPGAERTNYCHQCRRSTDMEKMWCSTCSHVYCSRCIDIRYPEIMFDASAKDFSCPSCNGECNCTYCTRKRGEEYVGSGRGSRLKRPLAIPKYTPTPDPPTPFNGDEPGVSFGAVYGLSGELLGTSTVAIDRRTIVVHRNPIVPTRRVHDFVGKPRTNWIPRDSTPPPSRHGMWVGKKPHRRPILPIDKLLAAPRPSALRLLSSSPLTELSSSPNEDDTDEPIVEDGEGHRDASLASEYGTPSPTSPLDEAHQAESEPLDCSPDTLARVIAHAMGSVAQRP